MVAPSSPSDKNQMNITKKAEKEAIRRRNDSFSKKYGCTPVEAFQKACKEDYFEGDHKWFFRLIEWDKKFLFEDEFKMKILAAQMNHDSKFFRGLSGAIRRASGYYKRTKYLDFAICIDFLIRCGALNPSNPKSINEWRKRLKKKWEEALSQAKRAKDENLVDYFECHRELLEHDPTFRKFVKDRLPVVIKY